MWETVTYSVWRRNKEDCRHELERKERGSARQVWAVCEYIVMILLLMFLKKVT
jgi:hypothetical protein